MAFILGGNTSIYLASVGGSPPFVFDPDALQFINEWGTASLTNSISTEIFVLNKIY